MLLGAGLVVLVDRLAPSARVYSHLRVWWPLVLVLLGVGGGVRIVLASKAALRGPAFLTLAGLLSLLVTTDALPNHVRPLLWPTVLLAAGISMLVGLAARRPEQPGSDKPPVVTRLVSIAESRHVFWPVGPFSLGTLTTIASGCVIDLRDAQPLDGRARIDVTAIFGGIEIRVPPGWQVEYEQFGHNTRRSENREDRPILYVKVVTFLAGATVRHLQPPDPEVRPSGSSGA